MCAPWHAPPPHLSWLPSFAEKWCVCGVQIQIQMYLKVKRLLLAMATVHCATLAISFRLLFALLSLSFSFSFSLSLCHSSLAQMNIPYKWIDEWVPHTDHSHTHTHTETVTRSLLSWAKTKANWIETKNSTESAKIAPEWSLCRVNNTLVITRSRLPVLFNVCGLCEKAANRSMCAATRLEGC